jgi:hypothetical protein
MNAPERRSPAVRRDVLAAHDDRYEVSSGRSSADVRTDAASYIPGGYVTGEPATEGALHQPHGVPRVSVATVMPRDVAQWTDDPARERESPDSRGFPRCAEED